MILVRFPPTIRLPARPLCPSQYVPTVASRSVCPVTYHVGLSEGHDMIWNISVNGWRFSGDVPLRVGQTCPLTVHFPNQLSLFVADAIVRWVRG